jgi:hypothetical protein
LPVQAERGYLIVAVNTDSIDYVACARRLNASLKHWHPAAQTCLLTDQPQDLPEFDHVITLPYGDQASDQPWKLSNDWQAFHASPFIQTIKLEADMMITRPIDHWWAMLQHRDVDVSTGARNYYGQVTDNRAYRKIIDANNLPDVYNAITFFLI